MAVAQHLIKLHRSPYMPRIRHAAPLRSHVPRQHTRSGEILTVVTAQTSTKVRKRYREDTKNADSTTNDSLEL